MEFKKKAPTIHMKELINNNNNFLV